VIIREVVDDNEAEIKMEVQEFDPVAIVRLPALQLSGIIEV
jgi:hypothetical protein